MYLKNYTGVETQEIADTHLELEIVLGRGIGTVEVEVEAGVEITAYVIIDIVAQREVGLTEVEPQVLPTDIEMIKDTENTAQEIEEK